MLLVLIDFLEKILAWLRPFSEKKDQDSTSTARQPSSNNFVLNTLNPLSASTNEAQLIAALEALMSDRTKNKTPKVNGYLAQRGGGPIFYGNKANLIIWIEFHRDYGDSCDVSWKQP